MLMHGSMRPLVDLSLFHRYPPLVYSLLRNHTTWPVGLSRSTEYENGWRCRMLPDLSQSWISAAIAVCQLENGGPVLAQHIFLITTALRTEIKDDSPFSLHARRPCLSINCTTPHLSCLHTLWRWHGDLLSQLGNTFVSWGGKQPLCLQCNGLGYNRANHDPMCKTGRTFAVQIRIEKLYLRNKKVRTTDRRTVGEVSSTRVH